MNSYELSRSWFDFAFENPEKITPSHAAIYFFAIEHCNRLGWKEKFGFPTLMAMEATGIKKNVTYIKYLNDLIDWGFIKLIEKSKNQYSSNVISLKSAIPKKGKALDIAMVKHSGKQINSEGESEGESEGISEGVGDGSINKPINIEQLTFEIFRKRYEGKKRGFKTEFDNFKTKHKDWKQVIDKLMPALQAEINWRKNKVGFVPEWKNLQTWLNQRCWEQEFEASPTPKKELKEIPASAIFTDVRIDYGNSIPPHER